MDRIKKFINKNKRIIRLSLFGLLALLFIIAASMNGCNRKRANTLSIQLAKIKAENSMMKNEIASLHIEIEDKELLQDSLKFAYNEKVIELDKLKSDHKALTKELDKLKDDLVKVPAEESYQILITEAYPFPGEMKFPFNEPQVKNIHLNWIENGNLKMQNLNLSDQVLKSELMIDDLENLNKACEDKYDLLSKRENQYRNLLDNTEQALFLSEKELAKIRRSNKALYYGIGGSALGGFLLGLLIFN